jgi:D-beta-D-heptose 7-phosphate kinase/D-beta-D-heptose 1-phosphate adenosyltransferase
MGGREVLERAAGRRVLVVGDVMLDEYLHGSASRVSQEAPVLVVEYGGRSHGPGGAANAAANAASLGASATLAGVVGEDEAAGHLRAALAGLGVHASLLADGARPTTTKTRVMARGQQVVRIDRESRVPLGEALGHELARLACEALSASSVCLLSDYGKGAVTHAVASAVIGRAAALGVPSVVDPKGADPAKYRGASLVKPNLDEARALLGRALDTDESLHEGGRLLLERAEAHAVLITRGAAGMDLFTRGSPPLHVPALAREVADVTGAGDTVAAVIAVALAAGAGLGDAARLAARAAAAAVGRLGAAPARPEDLLG